MDEHVEMKRSLSAERIAVGAPMVSRSFRFRRPRGGFCQQGYCHQCACTDVDGNSVLACQTPARRGVTPAPLFHPMRGLGWIAERLTPWFWERPIYPAFLNDMVIQIMRHLGNAPALPDHAPHYRPKSVRTTSSEVLVVGGGLAGMTAAAEFSAAGRTVTLAQDRCLGGTSLYLPNLRDAVAATQARLSGVSIVEHAAVIGFYEADRSAFAVHSDALFKFEFETLVVATGAYDRPLLFRNNDIPGIVGMRAFEKLLYERAISPNTRVGVFAGSLEAPRIMAAARSWNRTPSWISGLGSLCETEVRTLAHTKIVAANGASRIKSVTLEPHAVLPCDLLVIGYSQPTYALQRQAGMEFEVLGDPLLVVPTGSPSIELLIVGEALQATTPSRVAEETSHHVRSFLAGRPQAIARPEPPPWPPALPPDEAFICFCEDVRFGDIRKAVAQGFNDIELVKRRTGAGTGPCQGKMCHSNMIVCAKSLGLGLILPTSRPPLRPLPLSAYYTES